MRRGRGGRPDDRGATVRRAPRVAALALAAAGSRRPSAAPGPHAAPQPARPLDHRRQGARRDPPRRQHGLQAAALRAERRRLQRPGRELPRASRLRHRAARPDLRGRRAPPGALRQRLPRAGSRRRSGSSPATASSASSTSTRTSTTRSSPARASRAGRSSTRASRPSRSPASPAPTSRARARTRPGTASGATPRGRAGSASRSATPRPGSRSRSASARGPTSWATTRSTSPGPGTTSPSASTPTGCPAFEHGPLATSRARSSSAIRKVDREHTVWYEPVVTANSGHALQHDRATRGATSASTSTTTAWPAPPTRPAGPSSRRTVDNAEAHADANDVPILLSEFGATDDLPTIARMVDPRRRRDGLLAVVALLRLRRPDHERARATPRRWSTTRRSRRPARTSSRTSWPRSSAPTRRRSPERRRPTPTTPTPTSSRSATRPRRPTASACRGGRDHRLRPALPLPPRLHRQGDRGEGAVEARRPLPHPEARHGPPAPSA